MTRHASLGGGLPVGHLSALPPLEVAAVLALRLWSNGDEVQERLRAGIEASYGPGAAAALEPLADLCTLLARHARRPLMRHATDCHCVGADEACFAGFIAAAAEGRHEDALMIAVLIVRPDIAPLLLGLAESAGLALHRLALQRDAVPACPRHLH